jgi:hypothetical protein
MMFSSLLADASGQADTAPAWLVPVITGSAGLVGTLIGGSITYKSAQAADKRKEASEEKRQKAMQVKDVSVRFLKSITRMSIQSSKFKEFGEKRHREFEEALDRIDQIGQAETDKASTEAPSPTPASESTDPKVRELTARVAELTAKAAAAKEHARSLATMARDVNRGFTGLDDELGAEIDGLLAEMSLIMPTETVHKAEKAVTEVIKRVVGAYLPPDKKPDVSLSRNAINAFINDVRALMGQVGSYETLNDAHEIIKFIDDAIWGDKANA